MNQEQFIEATEKIYQAIRKAYGYDEEAETIMEAFDEMADAWESAYAGANIKVKE